ncbi:RsbRD N-terminal domain-containing protein [Desulfolithobacter sp.]
MQLAEALNIKKEKILSTWIDRVLDSYASPGFFKSSRDAFANPVGVNIRDGLTRLFELLTAGASQDEYASSLDQVIRIRAVQEFTPAQAVAPILELKWVVRQILAGDKKTRPLLADLDSFDCDVDRAALAAFDIYTDCRERLYQQRIRELKSGSYVLTDTPCASALLKRKVQEVPDAT